VPWNVGVPDRPSVSGEIGLHRLAEVEPGEPEAYAVRVRRDDLGAPVAGQGEVLAGAEAAEQRPGAVRAPRLHHPPVRLEVSRRRSREAELEDIPVLALRRQGGGKCGGGV